MNWAEIMSASAVGSGEPATLLRAAGKEAIRRKAGYRASQTGAVDFIPPSGTATAVEPLSDMVRYAIAKMPEVVPEVFRLLEARGFALPWGCLPEILENYSSLRPSSELLGDRGLWLSQFVPKWKKAVARGQGARPAWEVNWRALSSQQREHRIAGMLKEQCVEELSVYLKLHRDWSPEFSELVLESVREHINRASPIAELLCKFAPHVAANLHFASVEIADQLLYASHASPQHPIAKAWFPILSVRRRLHKFFMSLPKNE